MISFFVTVATVHTALMICILATKLKPPGAMRLRPRGHDFDLNSINETLLSDYTDSVVSGCVVIFKIFTDVY